MAKDDAGVLRRRAAGEPIPVPGGGRWLRPRTANRWSRREDSPKVILIDDHGAVLGLGWTLDEAVVIRLA